jgi:hypothetical protein
MKKYESEVFTYKLFNSSPESIYEELAKHYQNSFNLWRDGENKVVRQLNLHVSITSLLTGYSQHLTAITIHYTKKYLTKNGKFY